MQPGPAAGDPAYGVRPYLTALEGESDDIILLRPPAAADAGPNWNQTSLHPPFSQLAEASETMSMRHPVSFAARRAFCPSLPIARDSWYSGTTARAER